MNHPLAFKEKDFIMKYRKQQDTVLKTNFQKEVCIARIVMTLILELERFYFTLNYIRLKLYILARFFFNLKALN